MRAYIFGYLVLISIALVGQAKLEFVKTSHDFGEISEEDGAVEYSFLFVNAGDQALRISKVNASCGCTTSYWTKEEILPGDSGRISAKYNPFNRPGVFEKSLQVLSSGINSSEALHIKGRVIPKSRSIESDLPIRVGAMRLKNRAFSMGNITTENPVKKRFEVYNHSDSTFSFLIDEMKLPAHISMAFEPQELPSGQRGELVIEYDPVLKNSLGYHSDQITIKTSGQDTIETNFNVLASIEEYFVAMTEEELANAAKLTLSKMSHDFGKVAKEAVVETEFLLINSGKNELIIRSTLANCDCVVSVVEKSSLEPGERTKVKVTFDTTGRKGKQFKNVTIFSNDPARPSQMVTIKATVGG